jgi:hypothetical protein
MIEAVFKINFIDLYKHIFKINAMSDLLERKIKSLHLSHIIRL